MKNSHFAVFVLALIAALPGKGWAIQYEDPAFFTDVAMVEHTRLKTEYDLTIFRNEIAALDGKWKSLDPDRRALLFLRAAEVISSSDFGNHDAQYKCEQEYALMGLENALSHQVSLHKEMWLLFHVRVDMEKVSTPDEAASFAQKRTLVSKLWIHAWRRLETEEAIKFGSADMAQINVMPPVDSDGVGYPAGVSPEAIKDPKLRRQYEDAIAENRRKAERFSQHYEIMLDKDLFEQSAERYFVMAYTKGPDARQELNDLLATIQNWGPKKRILEALHQKAE